MHFKKKNAVIPENGKSTNPPSPRGVSGGAIFSWPFAHEFSQDWSTATLVGILHSYKEKEGLFIGTTLLPYFAATSLGEMKGFAVFCSQKTNKYFKADAQKAARPLN